MLYKYGEKEHVKSFIETGCLRIGTLYGFRNVELYGNEIGDSKEGTETVEFFAHNMTATELFNQLPHMRKGLDIANPDLVSFIGTTFTNHTTVPNSFIYCTTKNKNKTNMKKFDENYNAIISIVKPKEFFTAITMELLKQGWIPDNRAFLDECVYGDKFRKEDQYTYVPRDVNPAFLKEKPYAYQQEVRCVWNAKNPDNIPPHIFINCPEAVQYCKFEFFD